MYSNAKFNLRRFITIKYINLTRYLQQKNVLIIITCQHSIKEKKHQIVNVLGIFEFEQFFMFDFRCRVSQYSI